MLPSALTSALPSARSRWPRAALAAAIGLGGIAVAGPAASSSASTPAARPTAGPAALSPPLVPRVDAAIARDLTSPWALAFLPGGAALVSERDTGRIKRLNGKGGVRSVGVVPGVRHGGEGGLLGLAVHPDFARKPFVYAYLTSRQDNRIVRMRYAGGELAGPKVVLDGIPRGLVHNGGRLAFGPDGMLYAGTGEAGQTSLSQRRGSLGGKILRLTPSGRVPADNPRAGSYVFSRGHRNVQGLAFDGRGRLFAAEFGQNTFDELNLIRPGRNYGWPVVEGIGNDERFVDPISVWAPEEASPSGIAIVRGTVFMAGLRGQRLWRIRIGPGGDGVPAGRDTAFFEGRFGRLRAVEPAPDGALWLVTSNTDGRVTPRPGDDRVVRLTLR